MASLSERFEAAVAALVEGRVALVDLQVAARAVRALATLDAAASAYSELLTRETRIRIALSLDASEVMAARDEVRNGD